MLKENKSKYLGKIILVLLLITFTNLFPQGWNDIVETTIPFYPGTASKVDMFTNKDGIHIVVRYYQYPPGTDIFKYYLINTSGTVIRSTDIEVPGNVEFPNISGNENIVYIVYKLGSNLKAKKSTDAGQTWIDIPLLPIGNNTCNGVDIVYDYRGLHVVYAMQDNGSNYETYYYKLNSSDHWVDYKNVTDFDANEVGGFPSVTVSDNRVHVGYNTGNQYDPEVNQGDAKSRDKNNLVWEDPQLVFSTTSMLEMIFAGSSKLFDFYYELQPNYPHAHLNVKERSFSGTNWSSPFFIQDEAEMNRIDAANTSNGKTHIVYPGLYSILYRYYDSGTWSDPPQYIGDWFYHPNISAVSNDLYVVYGYSTNYLKYRQYDAAPLTPVNFAGTTYNNHPKLTWSLNNEPDISGYEIYRKLTSGSGVFELLTTVSSNTTSYVDREIQLGGGTIGKVFYKIRSKDNHPYYSDYTNQIIYAYSGLNKLSIVNNTFEYKLFSNYPNPFNPSTQIKYSLSQDADVTLKVYDMLGTEVVGLVNETQAAGNHTINFNAKNLSSGVYIYRITAANNGRILFTDSKQMILLR